MRSVLEIDYAGGMNAPGNTGSVARSTSDIRGVLFAGITAGFLDIVYAFGVAAQRGRPPRRVLQTIASGLLGSRAFEGGAGAALLGLLCQFVIATGAAFVYFIASRRLTVLLRRPIACGAIYGVLVYLFMNFVVLPLSAFPLHVTYPVRTLVQGFLSHMVFVGIPIALLVRRFSSPDGTRRVVR
jgi:uncharacterized membrane protein YagU involved in acid resistance